MKTFTRYNDIPKDHLVYLGSSYPSGAVDEALADAIEEANNPAQLLEDGLTHYFDLSGFVYV
jgi:hypothetical protein